MDSASVDRDGGAPAQMGSILLGIGAVNGQRILGVSGGGRFIVRGSFAIGKELVLRWSHERLDEVSLDKKHETRGDRGWHGRGTCMSLK